MSKLEGKDLSGDENSSSDSLSIPLQERRVGLLDRTPEEVLRIAVGWTVITIYVIALGVDMLNLSPDWDIPAPLHFAFTTIVGSMYIISAATKPKNGDKS